MKPLISIIVPCYNAERWVGECIKSCLNQTYENIEIIFIDDGSEDRSVEIVKALGSSKIKIIWQQNRGPSAARNRGLVEARGEFINYLDADDLLDPNKIELQFQCLSGRPETVATCQTYLFKDGANATIFFKDFYGKLEKEYEPALDILIDLRTRKERWLVQTATWLIPASICRKSGAWREDVFMGEDYEYVSRVLRHSRKVVYVKDAAVRYRAHPNGGNLLDFHSKAKQENYFYCLTLIEENLGSDFGKYKQAIANDYLQLAEYSYLNGDIFKRAHRKAHALGGANFRLHSQSRQWGIQLIQRVFGWRAARIFQYYYHELKNLFLGQSFFN